MPSPGARGRGPLSPRAWRAWSATMRRSSSSCRSCRSGRCAGMWRAMCEWASRQALQQCACLPRSSAGAMSCSAAGRPVAVRQALGARPLARAHARGPACWPAGALGKHTMRVAGKRAAYEQPGRAQQAHAHAHVHAPRPCAQDGLAQQLKDKLDREELKDGTLDTDASIAVGGAARSAGKPLPRSSSHHVPPPPCVLRRPSRGCLSVSRPWRCP